MSGMILDYAFKCFTIVNEKDRLTSDVEVDNFSEFMHGGDNVKVVFRRSSIDALRAFIGGSLSEANFNNWMAQNPKKLLLNPLEKSGMGVAKFLVTYMGNVEKVFESYQFKYVAPEITSPQIPTNPNGFGNDFAAGPQQHQVPQQSSMQPQQNQEIPTAFGVGNPNQIQKFTHQAEAVGDAGFAQSEQQMAGMAMAATQSITNLLAGMDTFLQVIQESKSLGRFEQFNDEDFTNFTFAYDNVPAEHVKIGFRHILQVMWQNKNEDLANKIMTEFLNFLETKDALFNTLERD